MPNFKYFLDDYGQFSLEVEAEIFEDADTWPVHTWADINAVGFLGTWLKLDHIPNELKDELKDIALKIHNNTEHADKQRERIGTTLGNPV